MRDESDSHARGSFLWLLRWLLQGAQRIVCPPRVLVFLGCGTWCRARYGSATCCAYLLFFSERNALTLTYRYLIVFFPVFSLCLSSSFDYCLLFLCCRTLSVVRWKVESLMLLSWHHAT